MTCSLDNREERLLDYVSGSLEAREAALFEKHLEACAECRDFVAGQKAVWNALDVFEPAPVSADFDRRLYTAMAQTSWWDRLVASVTTPFRTPALTTKGMLRHGLPIAAAAAALTAGLFVWDRPETKPAVPSQPSQLTAQADSLQPDQVQRALDDMDMLRQFNSLVASGSPQSKM